MFEHKEEEALGFEQRSLIGSRGGGIVWLEGKPKQRQFSWRKIPTSTMRVSAIACHFRLATSYCLVWPLLTITPFGALDL